MRGSRLQCRILKRCFLFFVTISILPLALVYLATSDQISSSFKNKNYDYENETQYQAVPVEQYSQSEIEIAAVRMKKRGDHLETKCNQYGLDIRGNDSLHKPNPWEFLINQQHKLVWCNVFKAASTSWMYNFNVLAGYSPMFLKKTNVVPLSLARKKYPRPTVEELEAAINSSTSFLIVRHPFERLLSAYRDKLQFALPHTFHQKLGNQIIRKYRKKKPFGGNLTRWPSFPEFINYLLDEFDKGSELDMHWTPITNFCTPCQVHFDVIAKFETLGPDQNFLIEKAGLKHLISPQWKNSGKGKSTKDLIMKYYTQLSYDQLQRLYEYYKYDFELFGYSADEYFEAILTETTTTSTHIIDSKL